MARVLVVDDETLVRGVVGRMVAKADHEVHEASDGVEAVERVREGDYDVVLLDINMPEMNGIEVISKLRDIAPELPVVAMSGGGLLPKSLLLANANLLGASETIEKPFKPEELVATIERALASCDGAPATVE
jgi:CheY-like chemotaxis protein